MKKQDKMKTNFDPLNETKTKVETDVKNHFQNTYDNGKQNFQNISQQYHRTWFSFSKDHYSQCLSININGLSVRNVSSFNPETP